MEKLLNGGLNLLILNRCNRQDMDILLNVELRTSFKCPHYLFNLGSKTVDIYNNNRVMVFPSCGICNPAQYYYKDL